MGNTRTCCIAKDWKNIQSCAENVRVLVVVVATQLLRRYYIMFSQSNMSLNNRIIRGLSPMVHDRQTIKVNTDFNVKKEKSLLHLC